jgi:hypothetical protein
VICLQNAMFQGIVNEINKIKKQNIKFTIIYTVSQNFLPGEKREYLSKCDSLKFKEKKSYLKR